LGRPDGGGKERKKKKKGKDPPVSRSPSLVVIIKAFGRLDTLEKKGKGEEKNPFPRENDHPVVSGRPKKRGEKKKKKGRRSRKFDHFLNPISFFSKGKQAVDEPLSTEKRKKRKEKGGKRKGLT